MRRLKTAGIFLTVFILFWGCSFRNKLPDINRKARVLAVMPFDNLSNDVAGAEVCRKKTFDALINDGYTVMDLERTDSMLRGLGVTDGGQLRAVEISKLAEGLGTNTFVTGEVQEYFQGVSMEVIPFGLCFKRQVRLKITVKDILTGQILYTGEKELVKREPLDQQEEKKKENERKKKELEKAGKEGGKSDENNAKTEIKEPSFLENLLGGILRNTISDTIYSGAELMAYSIAHEIVNEMPYYYER